jgi:CheY-like chemotaxis protein
LLRASLPSTIEIRKRIECWESAVRSDPTQIHQVVLNLCSNAAHAMQDGGGVLEVTLDELELSAAEAARFPSLSPGRHVSLAVRDTGTGIEPAVLERMFEPFYTTKGPGEGTGMGLAVVHGIVARHQGTIEVVSAPGAGATFKVLLPAVELEERAETPDRERSTTGRGTVLLVDDEAPIVESVEQILARLGYDVIARTDPLAALALFEDQDPAIDAALVDHMMPGMTGIELAHQIRARHPHLPVVLYTGHSGVIGRDALRAAGVREVLTKPLTRAELAAALGRALDGTSMGDREVK